MLWLVKKTCCIWVTFPRATVCTSYIDRTFLLLWSWDYSDFLFATSWFWVHILAIRSYNFFTSKFFFQLWTDVINKLWISFISALSFASSSRDFDPRSRPFSDEELKPQPMVKKSRKQVRSCLPDFYFSFLNIKQKYFLTVDGEQI